MHTVAQEALRGSRDFRAVADAFLAQPGLPFVNLLSPERIERVFAKHGNLFGIGTIYSTAMMVWSFLSQVLRDGKEASCQAAVARVVAHQMAVGGTIPTADTGDYCRARAKLSEAALRDLTLEIGAEVESRAEKKWLWKGKHAKLVDGFTFTMPDTSANQAEYPQSSSQKVGVGFPIARACAVLSLATASVLSVAVGPYSGKQTGETALLREQFAGGTGSKNPCAAGIGNLASARIPRPAFCFGSSINSMFPVLRTQLEASCATRDELARRSRNQIQA